MGSKYENLLGSGSANVIQACYDSFLKSNADFRSKAGFKMTVIRESIGVCCDWCQDLVGTYDYDNRPSDIYARHQNCNCIVVTKTERGTYQDAWSRKEYESYRDARIAREQEILNEQSHKNIIINTGKDVTLEYIQNSTVGAFKIEKGYDIKTHKNEINFAKWLKNRLGGDIQVLNEINENGVKTADYLWNGKLWDLKTVSSEKAANSAIRSGLKQIKENPGGIILDYGNYHIDEQLLSQYIEKRMKWYTNTNVDIFVKSENRFTIIRFKK